MPTASAQPATTATARTETLNPPTTTAIATPSWMPGARRYFRKKIVRGRDKTANMPSNTSSIASSAPTANMMSTMRMTRVPPTAWLAAVRNASAPAKSAQVTATMRPSTITMVPNSLS